MRSDCQPLRELLDSYLSGELLVETNHELLRHLDRCAECSAELERRRRLRRLMKETFGADLPATDLESHIVGRLETRSFWRRAAIATAIILPLLAGISLVVYNGHKGHRGQGPRDSTVLADSIAGHESCALHMPPGVTLDLARVERRIEAPYLRVVSELEEDESDYALVDGHSCPVERRPFTHIVLRGGGHTLSLFIAPRTGNGLPAIETRASGFTATGRETARHLVVVVSDLPLLEHHREAERLLPRAAELLETVER